MEHKNMSGEDGENPFLGESPARCVSVHGPTVSGLTTTSLPQNEPTYAQPTRPCHSITNRRL